MKRTYGRVRPAKIQISLRIRAGRSVASLDAFGLGQNARFLYSNNEDSDRTAWIRRLISVFAARTCPTVRFLKMWLIRLLLVVVNGSFRATYIVTTQSVTIITWLNVHCTLTYRKSAQSTPFAYVLVAVYEDCTQSRHKNILGYGL